MNPDSQQPPTNASVAPTSDAEYKKQIEMLQKQNQLAQNQTQAAQAQLNARPKAPDFKGLTDADGKLLPQFEMSNGSGFRDIANAANAAKTNEAMNTATANNMGASSAARTALATKGGLSGGAALRLAETGAQNLANSRQDVTGQSMKNAADIEGKTFDIGREAEKANIGARTSNQGALNQFDLSRYAEQMKEWAAEKGAQAQENAANSGGKKGK